MKVRGAEIDQRLVRSVAIAIANVPAAEWREMDKENKSVHLSSARRAVRAYMKFAATRPVTVPATEQVAPDTEKVE